MTLSAPYVFKRADQVRIGDRITNDGNVYRIDDVLKGAVSRGPVTLVGGGRRFQYLPIHQVAVLAVVEA